MTKRQLAVDVSSSEGSRSVHQCSSGSGSHAENVTACLMSVSSVPKHRTEDGKEVSQAQAWSRAEGRWPV